MAHTLVTGATGFLGAALVRHLLAAGHTVRILRRPTSSLDLLGEAARAVEHAVGDVTDPLSLPPAMGGIDQIYHAAAYVGFGGPGEAERLYAVNVRGTAHVVDAALKAGVGRLVHTSSMAAFGRPLHPQEPIDESTSWQASKVNTAYAQSKYEAELEVQRGIAEGLDAVLVNPALIFGVGRAGENTRLFCERVRDRRLPAVPAGGTNVVDVEDVAAGHLRAMQHGATGARYFLGSENLSWREIADTLAEAFGVAPPRFVLPPRLALLLGAAAEGVATLTRTAPAFSRELARTSAQFYRYRNDKAVTELGCAFRPFSATAARIADAIG